MNDNYNMTIIGGTRGLGRWIAEHLSDDFNITITSRDKLSGQKVGDELGVMYSDDNISAVKDADIIIFSVPIEHMTETIKRVAPHAREGSLLMDVCSIKSEAAEALKNFAPDNAEILPCHPMFGPRVPTLERQIVVLTPVEGRCEEWIEIIKAYLTDAGCEIVITTPHEHDKYMSIVQGLTHFSFISLASTIRKLNINVKRSRSFSSPVYSLMLDMVSRIVFQNPYLYYSIQKNNTETANARHALINEGIYLSKLIEDGEEDDFVKRIHESAEHLDEREEALVRSDMAISMMSQKTNILTKAIGMEVGLRDFSSEEVYVGVVKKVTSKSVVIECDDEISLNLSGIDIISDREVLEWKKNNMKLEHFDLPVMFSSKSREKYLLDMFKNIDNVIDVEIKDCKKFNNELTMYIFHYTLFDKKFNSYVREYIEGVGGIISFK